MIKELMKDEETIKKLTGEEKVEKEEIAHETTDYVDDSCNIVTGKDSSRLQKTSTRSLKF